LALALLITLCWQQPNLPRWAVEAGKDGVQKSMWPKLTFLHPHSSSSKAQITDFHPAFWYSTLKTQKSH